jgi:TrmH family RNA methyltransferase
MIITSSSNTSIKNARGVRDGRERDLIFVEGEKLAAECIASGLTLHACFVPPEPTEAMLALIEKLTCPVSHVAQSVLESLSDTVATQGIILIAERPWPTLEDLFAGECPLLLGLDRVQDPGNLGTLIRTAEAAGCTGVLAFAGSADAFSPKSLRSSMGSAFRLPIISGVTDAGAVGACRSRGVKTLIASGDGEITHFAQDWRQPSMLILGNEARGVSASLKSQCDASVRIPLHTPVESLNVAAAGAAILFEAVRQRML